MFDFVQSNKKFAQIILVLISLTFAFWGINSYFSGTSSGDYVAKIGDQRVMPQEFARALSERQEQLRRTLGGKVDPALLDSQDMRAAVLETLIRQRLLLEQARRRGIVVSDDTLYQRLSGVPEFQENGAFSPARYKELLAEVGQTAAQFEDDQRRELMLERVGTAYGGTAPVSNTVAERLLRINNEQREVGILPLLPEQFLSQVKPDPGAAKQYYDAHAGEFQVPEQARLDYVVFSIDMVAAHVAVSDDEVRRFYETNHARYAQDEQRRASHILIAVDAGADAAQKQAARARAEQLLRQVRRNPAQFAEVARKNSQDPGSAVQGGDLGWFRRGAMVKPFDDAVFGMKPGEISDLVETQYGYHIIRLDGVKGRGFDEIKPQAADDLRRQKAMQQFSKLAEQLSDLTYEQGDSLQPAADALKLTIQHSGWIGRADSGNPLLGNAKLLQAVFSDDVLKNKRNTDAIDVGNNTLIVARVADYRLASTRPFAEVSAGIEGYLARQQAAELAAKQGDALLKRLQHGEAVTVNWSPSKPIKRSAGQEVTNPLMREVFRADVSKLPAYGGVEIPQRGYVLFRISNVVEDNTAGDGIAAAREQLRQITGQEELSAYIAALKAATDVTVNQKQLEKQQ